MHDLVNNNNVRNDANFSNIPHSSIQDNSKYFKEIIRQQGFFKTQLWQMADDLREIKDAIITSNLMRQNLDGDRQQDTRSIYSSFHLPLRIVEDIEGAVEQFLINEDNFERSCTEACTVGGTSPYNFIKRNLDRLVSNELAQQYSWLGAKAKRKFSDLRFANMLLAASAALPNSTYTKLDVEKAIQKWLKRAKEQHDAERKKLKACGNGTQ